MTSTRNKINRECGIFWFWHSFVVSDAHILMCSMFTGVFGYYCIQCVHRSFMAQCSMKRIQLTTLLCRAISNRKCINVTLCCNSFCAGSLGRYENARTETWAPLAGRWLRLKRKLSEQVELFSKGPSSFFNILQHGVECETIFHRLSLLITQNTQTHTLSHRVSFEVGVDMKLNAITLIIQRTFGTKHWKWDINHVFYFKESHLLHYYVV